MGILVFWLIQAICFYTFLYLDGYWKKENAGTKMNDITVGVYILSCIAIAVLTVSLIGFLFGTVSEIIENFNDYAKLLSREFNRFIQEKVDKINIVEHYENKTL